jgi:hypothetical protein
MHAGGVTLKRYVSKLVRCSLEDVLQRGISSGLPSISFKMDDSFSTVSKCIKQRAVVEFLTRENGTPTGIHWWLLAFYDEDNCGYKYWASLGNKIEG